MSRTAHFGKDTQQALVEGLNYVVNATKSTMGPAGRNVIIQRKDKTPILTKDGVSVAKQLSPKDEKIKLGADLAISIAQKQMDTVGDGTTTATVLGQAIVNSGIRQIELSESPINRTALRRGIEKARDHVIKKLEDSATEITSKDQLIEIATVSANGDKKLGTIIAEAYNKVGKTGVVTVEETKDRDISLLFKEGMTLDRGWTSQYFVTDHDNQTVEYDNPKVLLCNSRITNFQTIIPIVNDLVEHGEAVVIIAEGYDTAVTQALVMNKLRSGIKIVAIEAPSYGERRLEILRDLGVYLDAEVGDDPMGMKLEMLSSAHVGSCEKIIIKKDETIIRGGNGSKEKIEARIETIRGLIKATKDNDQYEKEQLNKRLAALTTGVAVIQVGGSSEEEIAELKDRVDDAQWACKSALEEGYLPGAGNSLLLFSETLESEVEVSNNDEALGVKIFANALKAPFKTIIENAGMAYEPIMKEVLNKNDIKVGYDARKLAIVNLIDQGIIDPLKAVKGAILAASSIASLILTADVCITEDKEEPAGMAFNLMGGMPGM